MNRRSSLAFATSAACLHRLQLRAPGRPVGRFTRSIPPDQIMDFNFLYARNCAGCHGAEGKGGAAIGLGDPVFLAIADDATIRRTAAERSSRNPHAGVCAKRRRNADRRPDRCHRQRNSILGEARCSARRRFSALCGAGSRRSEARSGRLWRLTARPVTARTAAEASKASSIVDGSYLALVSDQNLRTTVIAGRPELGAPDWRGDVPGKPMSPEDISDVVAWLAAQRPQFPGQPYSNCAQ